MIICSLYLLIFIYILVTDKYLSQKISFRRETFKFGGIGNAKNSWLLIYNTKIPFIHLLYKINTFSYDIHILFCYNLRFGLLDCVKNLHG